MATKVLLLAVLTVCGLATTGAQNARPGRCPAPSLTPAQCQLVRFAPCQNDASCRGASLKCCYNGCGLTCQTPVAGPRVTVKPGSCSPPSVQGLCANLCTDDASCKGELKCCKTACGGSVCSRPVTQQPSRPVIVPGSCPAPKSHPGPWVCGNTCASDADCTRGDKCCVNRCGASVCTTPSTA